jgi:hypothetical protein
MGGNWSSRASKLAGEQLLQGIQTDIVLLGSCYDKSRYGIPN